MSNYDVLKYLESQNSLYQIYTIDAEVYSGTLVSHRPYIYQSGLSSIKISRQYQDGISRLKVAEGRFTSCYTVLYNGIEKTQYMIRLKDSKLLLGLTSSVFYEVDKTFFGSNFKLTDYEEDKIETLHCDKGTITSECSKEYLFSNKFIVDLKYKKKSFLLESKDNPILLFEETLLSLVHPRVMFTSSLACIKSDDKNIVFDASLSSTF